MNRRQFLKMIGLGALAAAALPIKQEPVMSVDVAKQGSDVAIVHSQFSPQLGWVAVHTHTMSNETYLKMFLNGDWDKIVQEGENERAAQLAVAVKRMRG